MLTVVMIYAINMLVVTPLKRSNLSRTLRNTQRTRSQLVRTLDPQKVDISVDKSPGKRDLPLGDGDCQLSVGDKLEKQTEKTQHTFVDEMEAIAYGVQVQFEENSSFSRRVTETTINVARELGIPEDGIEKWAASRLARLIRDTEKLREIKSRLERLQRSSVQPCDNGNISGRR